MTNVIVCCVMPDFIETNYREIERFCEQFSIKFDNANPMMSLLKVLDLTLNKYPEDEFMELSTVCRTRLISLADAIKKKRIGIKVGFDKNIEISGLSEKIYSLLVAKGSLNIKDIKKELDKEDIFYESKNLTKTVFKVRKFLGYSKVNKFKSLRAGIKVLFNDGKGVTKTKDMFSLIKREFGDNVSYSSVSSYLWQLKRDHNLIC